MLLRCRATILLKFEQLGLIYSGIDQFSSLCLSICFSSRVKIDLDIVKKARVVDDVSSDAWEVSDLKVAFFFSVSVNKL